MNNRVKLLLLVTLLALVGAALFHFLDLGIKQPQKEVTLEEIERTFGYHASKHAEQRMKQRDISASETYITLEKGKKYENTGGRKGYIFHYNDLNVIVAEKTIVTLYRGKVKKRWKEVHE